MATPDTAAFPFHRCHQTYTYPLEALRERADALERGISLLLQLLALLLCRLQLVSRQLQPAAQPLGALLSGRQFLTALCQLLLGDLWTGMLGRHVSDRSLPAAPG